MNLKLRLMLAAVFALVVAGPIQSKPLPAVPQAALDELGVEQGSQCMRGFVFIDGRYITAPYIVTRRGNGIFINRVQVDQPVPWSYFDPDSGLDLSVGLVDLGEGDKFIDADETVSAQTPAENDGKMTEKVSSIDDLFGDADDGDNQGAAKEEVKQPKTISSIDDLFGDNDEDASAIQAPRTRAAQSSLSSRRAPVKLTATQIAERKEILKRSLNDERAFYERALVKGELYFFGTMHHKINGTYGTARALFEVLPAALRYSRTPDELQTRLEDGGVYFVDISVCQALYRHKTTFPLLQQRLEKIQLEESIKEANRKKY